MRLDEWQRYIDSEFVEPGRDKKQAKSRAIPLSGPAQPGNGAEFETPGPSLEANAASAEAEVPANLTPASSELSPDAGPRFPSTVTTHDLMDAPSNRPPDRIGAEDQPDPPANEINAVGTVESEIPPFADYISARRSGKESPVSQATHDHVPTPTSAFNDAPLPGIGDTTAFADPREHSKALDPATPYPLSAPSIILKQLQAGHSTNITSADAALAQRREKLLRRLLDPALSIEDTALLLGVSVAAVREYADGGILRVCEPPRNSGRTSRSPNPETTPRYFRLSDIIRFAASRMRADESESLFAQRDGPDQAA